MQKNTEEKVIKKKENSTNKRGIRKRYSASSWAEEAGRLTMHDVGGWGNPTPPY
jgi:hypothetical protein